ncbi:phosphatase PAP2 family protein [Shewanella litorisediminis]|uniref:undecaprenyl-diphosphate phosphatase n=1 Tax=Shewanella litorisediminis TaxID=1173586 RepID=A0ABX7G2C3_9GAMM|nr:phosphatase PAP2 family protein [Shewanella litorisediminis]MCL2917006.1 phosphatase PAP2 family protein [Shewanella litorisediminis]QRH01487.1 phosphatase PAP2 family protein [Shewanella litorisediminis]
MQHTLAPHVDRRTRPLLLLTLWLLLMVPATVLTLAQLPLFPWMPLDGIAADVVYAITFSGTAPWGAISAAAVALLAFLRLSHPQAIKLLLALGLSLGSSLWLNESLKTHFDEPRPNVLFLSKHKLLDSDDFYRLHKADRRTQMTTLFAHNPSVLPPMNPRIASHWQQEVGLSFPSGHTLFATILALTASWFFIASGHWGTCALLGVWALAMGGSRMLLGMHHSQDVMAATALSLPLSVMGIMMASWLGPRLFKSRQDPPV